MKKLIIIIFLSYFSFNLNAACKNVSNLDVEAWSFKAMVASYNIDFIDYDNQIKSSKDFYTKDAWKTYYQNLVKNKFIDEVKRNRFTVLIGAQRSPLIVSKGKTIWVVSVPLILNVQSDKENRSKKFMVLMKVLQNDQCQLKISKWSSSPMIPETKKIMSTEVNASGIFMSFNRPEKIFNEQDRFNLKSLQKNNERLKKLGVSDETGEALEELRLLQQKLKSKQPPDDMKGKDPQ